KPAAFPPPGPSGLRMKGGQTTLVGTFGEEWAVKLIAGFLLWAVCCISPNGVPPEDEWSWRQPHSEVLSNGDLKWKPQPFSFEKGDSLRYIDFDAGDDTQDGASREKPWKHHPWDSAALGNAQACRGIHTYVF